LATAFGGFDLDKVLSADIVRYQVVKGQDRANSMAPIRTHTK
jgi:hypothetical protein